MCGQYDGPVVVLTHDPPVTAGGGVTFARDLPTAVELAVEVAAGAPYVNVLGAGTRLFTRRGDTDVQLVPLTDEDAHWYRLADAP